MHWNDQYAIRAAIRAGCHTAEDIGGRVQAGTNCGSCVPELRALLAAEQGGERQTA